MDWKSIIDKYYNGQPLLREVLLTHSECVARKALECLARHSYSLDRDFIYEAAMLHDIGIFRTNAPDIYCQGDLPYICHGVEGSKLLMEEGLPRHALICERHTGAGLTIEEIKRQNLPLPLRDMLPVSMEEKLVCYADKFFSKSGDLTMEKSLERVRAGMARHGADSLARFDELHHLFG